MDPRIINDALPYDPLKKSSEQIEQHICACCECMKGNHLIFFKCPIFELNPVCQDCCQTDMLKEDVNVKISAKLGREVTKDWINGMCKSCGFNSACQNSDLATKIEKGNLGDNNNGPSTPIKTR